MVINKSFKKPQQLHALYSQKLHPSKNKKRVANSKELKTNKLWNNNS